MNFKVILFLLISGVLLIISALIFPFGTRALTFSPSLAQVTSLSGSAYVSGLDQIDSALIKKNDPIKNLDTVKTDSDTELTLFINAIKAEITLPAQSEVLFEETHNETISLTLKQGDIVINDFGPTQNKLWIKKDGQILSAVDYSLSTGSNNDTIKIKAKEQNTSNSLTQIQIEDHLQQKKSDFFKCYGQLIQRSEQAHGQVLLSFEISPIGKITTVQIARTDIKEPTFLACLKEVVARMKFPPFKGENITSFFPLNFE